MRRVHLFCEDVGHEAFLTALLRRFGKEQDVPIHIKVLQARGGHGKMSTELKTYVDDLQTSRTGLSLPDLIVVGHDANCRGFAKIRDEVMHITEPYRKFVVCAIPDPHIERWLLLDSAAFKNVLGQGCAAPGHKCEKDRYKRLLIEAVVEAGETPLLGGLEYAEDIVKAMDLSRMLTADDSIGRLIQDLRQVFKRWESGS